MPVREVLVCSKCGATIQEDPLLGDKQGGRKQIVHGANTWELVLCTKCLQPLYDLYEEFVEKVLPGGTAKAAEAIKYLPRVVDEAPAVAPPTFSGEG